MRKEIEINMDKMNQVIGGEILDPVTGYDYEEILKAEAMIVGTWIYDVFNESGAAGLKAALRKKYQRDTWFIKRFPVYDADGNIVG